MTITWLNIERLKEVADIGGTFWAVVFAGAAFFVDSLVRRAQTNLEITKEYRELWIHYDDRPALWGLRDLNRDLNTHPLTDGEVHFVNFLFNHLRATFYARAGWIFTQPKRISKDIQDTLSYPAIRSVWDMTKEYHDPKFVAFVERNRKAVSK